MAAVAMSPPQESSSVMAMPMLTHRSRTWRVLVGHSSLLIFRFTTSIAKSACWLSKNVEAVDVFIEHERVIAMPSH